MYWDPFDEIQRMHEEMDMLFNSFFQREPMSGCKELPGRNTYAVCNNTQQKRSELAKYKEGCRIPVSHVYETENAVICSVELPGVDKKDLEVNLTDDGVEVQVTKRQEKKAEKEGMFVYGAESQSFYRQIPLPTKIIPDKAEGTFNNGILRIELPKANPKNPENKRKLNIN